MRLAILVFSVSAAAQTWTAQSSGTTASLRGLSAASSRVAWASGTKGTYVRTVDGGAHWTAGQAPGAEELDFRDVEAVSDRVAYLLSAGPGTKSRIYKTVDAGAHWTLQFTNPDEKGFFDGFAFWDAKHGIAAGDPVDGRFAILTTADGGKHWKRETGPEAVDGEGAFAASGTSLAVGGRREVWLGSGGKGGARVFHSVDRGKHWSAVATPIRNDGAPAGIFGLAFAGGRGIAVGGDYTKPLDSARNAAVSTDGGRTWSEPANAHPAGFRSAAAFDASAGLWIATGTAGSDFSRDGGKSWVSFDGGFNALAVAGGTVWAAGSQGRIARLAK